MEIILGIADLFVVLAVVISVSRAVWMGQSQNSRSLLLPLCITLAMIVFGVVSFSAASGLAISSLTQGGYGLESLPVAASRHSTSNQTLVFVFLAAIAVVAAMSWADRPAQ